MVVLKIYSKYLKVDYKTTFFSKGTFFVFFTRTLCIILPFIFAYNSGGFWLKRDFFYEQPNVRFKGEYLFYATTTNKSQPIVCSNNPFYNKFIGDMDVCTDIKVREVDYNLDGKVDKLDVFLDVNLSYNSKITSFTFILPLDYDIKTVCPFKMESAIIFQHFLPIYVTKFSVNANLNVFQNNPLHCQRGRRKLHLYEKQMLENINKYIPIDNIIDEYSNRNISTYLTNIYTTFKTTKTNKFTLNLKAKYMEHKITYYPKFWHIIKSAWIQYLAIYIVITWFFGKLEKYIFDNKLVLYYETPLKKKL
ncbi:unnamed protein product [Brassicogethes aeneus]|uniref:Transmembrane protein 231 n=1 Tax=Brassicogethes aeneus TaxID=1431903 RepID=A0A9P0B8B6_BRAAE|nr:unnamed protein product [Brassicogethes aeneus]